MTNLNDCKNYYFLVRRVTTMGGAELLLLRRANLYKSMGMKVKIIVIYNDGDFILKERFKDFDIMKIYGMDKPYCCHTKQSLDRIDQQTSAFLGGYNDSIIESQTFHTAVWSEFLVSRHPTMKHVIYAVDDNNINSYICYPYSKLFEFKKQRGEFWGTEREGMKLIFDQVTEDDDDFLPVSFDEKELAKKTVPILPQEMYQKDAYVVSTLGRLEKGCYPEIIEACKNICLDNANIKITVVIGGGSAVKDLEEAARRKYSSISEYVPNLKVLFIGYIFAIGKDFYNNTDIYIGMGTSSVNSISQGCATINIDPGSKMASGVFGLNVFNFAYPEKGRLYELRDQIQQLLFDEKYRLKAQNAAQTFYNRNYTIEAGMKKQEKLYAKSAGEIVPFSFKPSMKDYVHDILWYGAWSVYKTIRKIFYPNEKPLCLN